MKLITVSLLLFLTVYIFSCTARLRVSVKILDRTYLIETPLFWKEKVRPLVLKAEGNFANGAYELIRSQTKANLNANLNKIYELSSNIEATKLEAISKPLIILDSTYNAQINLMSDSLKVVNLEINRLTTSSVSQSVSAPLTTRKDSIQKNISLIGSIRNRNKNVLDSIDTKLAQFPGVISIELLKDLKEGANTVIDKTINEVIRKHLIALAKYDSSMNQYIINLKGSQRPEAFSTQKLRQSYELLNQGFIELAALGDHIRRELDELSKLQQSPVRNALQISANTIASTTNKLTQQAIVPPFASIRDDALASIVAGADKKHWRALTNYAKGKTAIGNSDIAIVMEPDGEYTVKGIRNDASQATKATFDVLNLTIDALAKYSGVNMPSVPGTSDSTSTVTGKTIQAGSTLKVAKSNYQAVQISLFSAILGQDRNLSDTATYKASIGTIKTAFDAGKKVLIKQ